MNEIKALKISKGDEYRITGEILMNIISTAGISFFKDFDVEIKRFSDDEWIIKILNDNEYG